MRNQSKNKQKKNEIQKKKRNKNIENKLKLTGKCVQIKEIKIYFSFL